MTYFVTGATGFIGKRLVKKLLGRRGTTVYFLVRRESLEKVPALLEYWNATEERAVAVVGDLAKPLLGVSKADQKKLAGKVKHFFHLAAVYDLKADAESQIVANIEGTKNAVALANEIKAGVFQHVSSIAAAGLYEGVFREDMFDEAENLDHPYFATKHDSEKIVRKESKMPWRVYRPGMVVGDSKTGEMDKIDGPYYFFKLIQKMRNMLPPWMPADRHRRRAHQHRPGGLRGRCDRPHRACQGGQREGVPHRRSDAVPHRRRPEHLRQSGACPAVYAADQRCAGGLYSGQREERHAGADPGPAHPQRRDEGPRAAGRHPRFRQLPDALRRARGDCGIEGHRHCMPAAGRLRRSPVGLLGAQPRSGSVHRSDAEGPGAGESGRHHRRFVRNRTWRPRTRSRRPERRQSSSRATPKSSPPRRRKSKADLARTRTAAR